jgi:hypothetical protein
MAKFSLSALRAKLFRTAYVGVVVTAMVGWFWMIFVGVEWVLGA